MVFLATTALEDFWDVTQPIVFLGEWCLLYARRPSRGSLRERLLDAQSERSDAADAGYEYVNAVYERMLPVLGEALNSIHGESFNAKYWRIVLGPWLQIYVHVVYDRFWRLKHALDQYPGLTTIGLPEDEFAVPSDTGEFSWWIKEDIYNLQLFTKILAELGKDFPRKRAQAQPGNPNENLDKRSLKSTVFSFLARTYAAAYSRVSPPIVLKDSYFSKRTQFLLMKKTLGRIVPVGGKANERTLPQPDKHWRRTFPAICLNDNEFERCLSAMIVSDIPRCFVEGYGAIAHDARKTYPRNVKAIFSANGWYYDEAFKRWAAASAEVGAVLLGTPHGANYGGLKTMPSENHETAIVDYYYSWGWERSDCPAKVVPMPAPRLLGVEKIAASNRKEGILWACTSMPRYLTQFPFLPDNFPDYIIRQSRFAKSLLPKLLTAVRLRPHREDDWNLVQRMNDCIEGVRIEAWEIPFQQSLVDCRLYVCDHLSTTFAQALAANKPTILFWNPLTNELRPEARSYYELLRKNGILFDSPEDAAFAVNRVYADVESWWNDSNRQDAIAAFCDRFARTDAGAIDLWSAEFNRIAALPGFANDNATRGLSRPATSKQKRLDR